jgi:hypothetical protein
LIADGSPPGSSADVVRNDPGPVDVTPEVGPPDLALCSSSSSPSSQSSASHAEQVDCHATVPGVAGRFAQDHLLKVLALAEVIVDLPDDFPRGAAGANLADTRPLRTYRRLRP